MTNIVGITFCVGDVITIGFKQANKTLVTLNIIFSYFYSNIPTLAKLSQMGRRKRRSGSGFPARKAAGELGSTAYLNCLLNWR